MNSNTVIKGLQNPTILIVDDDEAILKFISRHLKRYGYNIIEAVNGRVAMNIIEQKNYPQLIILDANMPIMDGFQTCVALKNHSDTKVSEIPIIMVTGLDDNDSINKAFDMGAEEYINKPINMTVLRNRIKLIIEKKTAEKKLKEAYDLIKKDLKAAELIQKKLLPEAITLNGFMFRWIFKPSSFIGGDTFNFFKLDERYIGFYILDVTGHGIPSALLSFMASKTIVPFPIESSPLKRSIIDPPYYEILTPDMACEEINKRFQRQSGSMQYFTMVYAYLDIDESKIKLFRAGHVHPIFLPKDGNVIVLEKGGLPIGLQRSPKYNEIVEFTFNEGDRLFFYTDGITECTNDSSEMFSDVRLKEFVQENRDLPLDELNNKLEHLLNKWRGCTEFDDDITMLSIEKLSLDNQ
ncbi:MAG: fused response regulator/phosphatase [Nitrospirae bacterium]|nr:fused response regulator/phosphatase [Nitrospirota bacterium]MBF0540478.1 fused response regulator/phosphatase [Nitrospirota bacterium]